MPTQLCRKIIEVKFDADLAALTGQRAHWSTRSWAKFRAKTSRLDTATRMMIDSDFSLRHGLPRETQPTLIRTPVNKRDLKDQK